jgi:integrase
MPAIQRGQAYRLGPNRWGLRYYDADGTRRRKSPFPSKSAALAHYREVVEPQLRGDPAPVPELTLAELVPVYLERHGAAVRPRTIATLCERLRHAVVAFGDVPLRELERMPSEIAGWRARQPHRVAHHRAGALRQVLDAAVRWGYMGVNPAKLAGRNPKPAPRPVRAFSPEELEAISAKLEPAYRPLPGFAAATGLRPEEWQALERRRGSRCTCAGGAPHGLEQRADRTRQDDPQPAPGAALAPRSRGARGAPTAARHPARVPRPPGGLMNLDNWRRREWAPAIEAAGILTPARIYDLRSTFASDALAAGVSVFELARIMGTSIEMIERHYGTLLDGAGDGIAGRLDALDAARDRVADRTPDDRLST